MSSALATQPGFSLFGAGGGTRLRSFDVTSGLRLIWTVGPMYARSCPFSLEFRLVDLAGA